MGNSFAGPGGVEHLESGEAALPPDFFTRPTGQLRQQDVIAHEFLHSWNGRWRQPADLWANCLRRGAHEPALRRRDWPGAARVSADRLKDTRVPGTMVDGRWVFGGIQ